MTFLETPTQKKQFALSYGIFALNGMLALSVGTLLPFIRDDNGLDYLFIGLLVSLHSIGNLTAGFVAGILPLWVGRKKSALIFGSFYSLAFLFLAIGNAPGFLLLAFFMTGLARGSTSNAINKIVNHLAPGKAWLINGLHAMFAVGAFAFPLILWALTTGQSSNWRWAVYGMVLVGMVSFLCYLKLPMEEQTETKKVKTGNEWGFFKEPIFYLTVATLFFYLSAEQGVIGWLVTYFFDSGKLSQGMAQMMPSLLWAMILIGRLSTAYLSTRLNKGKLLLTMGAGMVLSFTLLMASTGLLGILTGIIGFGFFMAGVYPTTVSFAGKLMEKYRLAWSFIMTIAALGSILMPLVVGAVAQNLGMWYGMASIGGALGLALVFIVCLNVRKENP